MISYNLSSYVPYVEYRCDSTGNIFEKKAGSSDFPMQITASNKSFADFTNNELNSDILEYIKALNNPDKDSFNNAIKLFGSLDTTFARMPDIFLYPNGHIGLYISPKPSLRIFLVFNGNRLIYQVKKDLVDLKANDETAIPDNLRGIVQDINKFINSNNV